jgi:hypothetical protein
MTVSILATTDNGDPAFRLKQGTLARKRNLLRGLIGRDPEGSSGGNAGLGGLSCGYRIVWAFQAQIEADVPSAKINRMQRPPSGQTGAVLTHAELVTSETITWTTSQTVAFALVGRFGQNGRTRIVKSSTCA